MFLGGGNIIIFDPTDLGRLGLGKGYTLNLICELQSRRLR